MLLVQAQQFGTGTRYGLEILRHCDKRVKTKSQKVLEVNSYVFRSYKGKTGRGANFLIIVKALKRLLAVLHKLFMCFVKVSLWSMVISKTFTLLVLFICLFYTMNVMLLLLLIFRHQLPYDSKPVQNSALFDSFRCARSQFNELEYMVVSLQKLQTSISLMENIRSFMKKLNKIGSNIDPCGISTRISIYELKVDSIFIR